MCDSFSSLADFHYGLRVWGWDTVEVEVGWESGGAGCGKCGEQVCLKGRVIDLEIMVALLAVWGMGCASQVPCHIDSSKLEG